MEKVYEILIQALLSGGFAYLLLFLTQRNQNKNLKYQERNKFKLAAIDKRLQVAQEAFKLSLNFPRLAHENAKISSVETPGEINEVIKWWTENCLFLSNKARREFYECYISILFYSVSVRLSEKSEIRSIELDDKFERLQDLPNIIAESVDFEKLDLSELSKKNKKAK